MRPCIVLSILILAACSASRSARGPATSDETYRVVDPDQPLELRMSSTAVPHAATVPFAIDRVWLALPTIFDSLAISVETIDTPTHVMGNSAFQVRRRLGGVSLSQYIRCGRNTPSGPMENTYDIRLTVLSQLQPHGSDSTTVSTSVQALARPVGMSGTPVRCSSTGALEASLVSAVKSKLRR